jgi:hypothetical protein
MGTYESPALKKRVLGMTKRSIPPLLSMVGGKSTRVAPTEDQPPLSSSEEDSDDGLSTVGDIKHSKFASKAISDLAPRSSGGSSVWQTRSFRSLQRTDSRSTTKRSSAQDDISAGSESERPNSKNIRLSSSAQEEIFGGLPRRNAKFSQGGYTRKRQGQVKPATYGTSGRQQAGQKPFRAAQPIAKSPSPSRSEPSFSQHKIVIRPSPSPMKGFKAPGALQLSSPPARKPEKRLVGDSKKAKGGRRKKRDLSTENEASQQPSFVLPGGTWLDLQGGGALGGLNSGSYQQHATQVIDLVTSPLNPELTEKGILCCPLCGETVQDELTDALKKATRMTIREQAQFCHRHRRKSALDEWLARGFPDIDWLGLDDRIAKHHAALREVLNGAESHYRAAYAKKVGSGKSRTLLKEENSLLPGYYGNRGLRAMSESIVEHFSSDLRTRAVKDRLVSARGHTAFVQGVLVPELAMRLIMEDLHLTPSEARVVLQNSIRIGELVNDDAGDAGLWDGDDESVSDLSDIGSDS